jgi:uncharacterized membrane protein HdeD (DUF308 family)
MSDDFEYTAIPDDSQFVTESPRERLARHWGVLLTMGIITFALGAALAVWPGETVAVVALLLAFQLLVTGSAQLFLALVSRRGPARWATGAAGLAAVVIGVLLLVDPLQTLTFIGWAAGLCVVAIGAGDLLAALVSREPRHRGWQAVRGLLGVAIGLFLVANPDRSLGLLVVVTCVWLISYGFVTIVAAVLLRSEHRHESQAPAADGHQAPSAPA